MALLIKFLPFFIKLAPDLWDLFRSVMKDSPEEIRLNSRNKFRKLGDAKNEKDRVSALRGIQHLVRKS